MNQIVKVLMERDGYTKKEAETRLKEARMEFDPTTDDQRNSSQKNSAWNWIMFSIFLDIDGKVRRNVWRK